MCIKYKLENPPIKEVIFAISFLDEFFTIEDINKIYDGSDYIKKIFINRKSTQSFQLQLNTSPTITENKQVGYYFSSQNNNDTMILEPNRFLLSDKNKYISFDSFFDKIKRVFNEILVKQKTIKTKDVALRYVNQISLDQNNYAGLLKTGPCFNLYTNDKIPFATMSKYLGIFQINSVKNKNIKANVKTIFSSNTANKINMTLDIDVHSFEEKNIKNNEELLDTLLMLKEFKNEIFFSNLPKATEMKEFKNDSNE